MPQRGGIVCVLIGQCDFFAFYGITAHSACSYRNLHTFKHFHKHAPQENEQKTGINQMELRIKFPFFDVWRPDPGDTQHNILTYYYCHVRRSSSEHTCHSLSVYARVPSTNTLYDVHHLNTAGQMCVSFAMLNCRIVMEMICNESQNRPERKKMTNNKEIDGEHNEMVVRCTFIWHVSCEL